MGKIRRLNEGRVRITNSISFSKEHFTQWMSLRGTGGELKFRTKITEK